MEKEIEELRVYCRKIDDLVKRKGEKTEYCEARYKAAQIYLEHGLKALAFRQTLLAKNELYKIVKRSTRKISPDGNGFDLFELDDYCKEKEVQTKENELFWNLLFLESQDLFDSFMLYLERDRQPQSRYYYPRRDCLRKTGIVQGMQDLEDDVLDILSISMPPGTGKASRLSAKVLTPNGWVRMGDIKQGDKVIAGNGNVATVLGVFPQGKRPCYRVHMDDGSYTEVSDNHLWTVQSRDDRNKKRHPNGKYRTITTLEMMENLKVENGKRLNYSIDYVPRIDFKEKDFIIHPYIMGVLLGDGNLTSTPVFDTADQEMIDKVASLLPNGYTVKHKDRYTYCIHGHEGNNCKAGSLITKEIKRYGLFGTHGDSKFIPKDYLYCSYEQRMWLLRGLLDTDGSVNRSSVEYTTVSEQLAEDVRELVHSLGGYCSYVKRKSGYKDSDGNFVRCLDSYRLTIQFTSQHENPFYLSRKVEKYNPKRAEMKRFVTDIEYIGEEECQCIYISDECHLYITDDYIITHNTTLEKFFCAWVMGKHPEDYSLFFSHSSEITRMFFDGVKDIITNDTEYRYKEIFPKVFVQSTNAKAETLNLNDYKPFASLQCTSVGAKNSGKVRASRYLFCDDLIGGIEEALNKALLDKLWRVYGTDARQRKLNGKVKEIHIATRWSVHDVIGRLQLIYKGNDKARFIAVPDIDPVTGESNFLYKYNGMTVEFFHDQEKTMDDITYRCLYKNDPIEREGILYHDDELRRYFSLPLREPDGIYAIADTKNKGTDFMIVPVLMQYDDDYYCVDCVCDDTCDFGVQTEKTANLLFRNKVQQAEFESNNGGERVAADVDKTLKLMGGFTNITTKPTETNKETRIIVNADWVKKHILFKDASMYTAKEDYGIMMSWLCRYSIVGKNEHDDVPDCFANAALYFTRGLQKATCEAVFNPFRTHLKIM